jgi:S1-C subfamily serine protease
MRLFSLLLCFFSLASCVRHHAAYVEKRRPSGQSLVYAQQRVTALIVTKQTDISSWVKRGFPRAQTPPDTDGGTASPITADGYFLTADHVISKAPSHTIHILYGRGPQMRMARARVVWRNPRHDIAVIHAPFATPLYYQFTPPSLVIPEGTTVFHGGRTTGLKPFYGALNTTIYAENFLSGPQSFKIDIPLKPGDSGGPILDASAQLIGINSAVEFLIPMETPIFTESSGVRPNIRKLMKIIDKDRRR